MSQLMCEIQDLWVSVEGKQILKGVNLTLERGKIHAIMGRNGSGKSTLAHTILGHPRCQVTQGRIVYQGEEIAGLKTHERARKGLFLAFQYPTTVPGVTVTSFLRHALKALRGTEVPVRAFRLTLKENFKRLGIEEAFMSRYVNDGFSGGEKKRLEILQMVMLAPKLAVLDETDSGLDIDALKIVAGGIQAYASSDVSILLITHYQRMLNYITPHMVHVLMDGKIVRSGGAELARELEVKGYDWLEPAPAAAGAPGAGG